MARPSRSGNTTEAVMPRSANSLIMDGREAGSTTYRQRIDLGTNVSSPLLRFPCIVKHDLWLRSRGWTYVGWMANGSGTPGQSFSQAPRRFSKAGLRTRRFFGSGSCQTRGNSRTAEGRPYERSFNASGLSIQLTGLFSFKAKYRPISALSDQSSKRVGRPACRARNSH